MPKIMNRLGEELVFGHGDLGCYNILMLDNNEFGVIDFGDAGMYDRSKDFVGLEDETILEFAISTYGGNEILRKKVDIRQKILPILDLLYYIGKKDKT